MLWHFVHGFCVILEHVPRDAWNLDNEVVSVSDDHTFGLSSLDPVRHAELRQEYWKTIYDRTNLQGPDDDSREVLSLRDFRSAMESREEGAPCFIWTNMPWEDILFFWWVVDALNRIGIPIEDTSLVFLPERYHRLSEAECLKDKRPLSSSIQEYCLRCWEAFCGDDPRALWAALDDPQPLNAELSGLFLKGYEARFPRWNERTGRFGVSEYDRAILSTFAPPDWRLPTVLPIEYVRASTLVRIRKWAEDRYGAALELRENPKTVNPYMDYFHRLTPYGESLLKEGIPAGMSAPPDPCGGLTFYDPENLWALGAETRLVAPCR